METSGSLSAVEEAGALIVQFSRRFDELIAHERRFQTFGVFETRDDARRWLKD